LVVSSNKSTALVKGLLGSFIIKKNNSDKNLNSLENNKLGGNNFINILKSASKSG